jgi:molybdopterin synthase sulfur carrier subunit
MAVTFSLPTVLARLADGQSTIEANGTTLGDVVAQINDEDIRFQNGFATPVAEGDEITVVAAIAGG